MQMYPSYKLRDVLDEYAVVFFTLLEEGYRIIYGDYYMQAQLIFLPQMKDRVRRDFIRRLEWASKDPSDILRSSGKKTDFAKLKKILR